MDTKTLKTEALDLLALDELTDEQAMKLNLLTAQQHMKAGGSITLFSGKPIRVVDGKPQTDGFTPVCSVGGSYPPAYTHSVDACLLLLRPENTFWMLQYGESRSVPQTRNYAVIRPYDGKDTFNPEPQLASTLSLAMLKAFWAIQPD